MTTDDWMTAALADDAVVAELLLSMKHSSESYAPPPLLLPPLGWGHRQQRSKPSAKKERDSTRCSPTTPLSWSGATASPSDGCDESSRPSDPSSAARSKGTFTTETPNKRSRRKKTFTELKEEENLLLKEKIHLKKELETLQITLRDQKARSENLKRIKLDMGLQQTNKMLTISSDEPEEAISNQPNLMEASSFNRLLTLPTHSTQDCPPSSDSHKVQKDVEPQERCFVIPDLNMTPSEEEDSGFDTLYCFS
ncbi:uncharacterized protein LOC132304513 [Cornus florida]|uniref:uncharacterized protein LOC132304513 n=1 Tax=Cornus florida TaxID=4283 RepID=UPI002899103A|nr:uncharacterized protein LOC132304513 [Cornus florida]